MKTITLTLPDDAFNISIFVKRKDESNTVNGGWSGTEHNEINIEKYKNVNLDDSGEWSVSE